jgi:transposase
VILAEDEASLYLQASLTRVWAPVGQTPITAAHPGREKVNFYGTLNLHTGSVIANQADKMNALSTAAHLERILSAVTDVPILLLWDRAPWHRGEPIQQVLAAHPRLEILYLPTAAPDLNPQEQVWKATRTAVSHNHAQRDLSVLASRFERHLLDNTFHSSLLNLHRFSTICATFN